MKLVRSPALTAENVSLKLVKRQGLLGRKTIEHWALKNISFQVSKGEVFGVLGRNGSGKSSLLKLLARIIIPDIGKISVHGGKVSLLTLQAGRILELSGEENAILSGMFLGNTRQEMKELVTKIKDFSELGPWFHRSMLTYSSGMRARLGFSTALHIKGDIILVDEVLGVGDGAFQEKSSKAMQAMMESERTVVLVTHSPGKIADVCNNALWLDEGEAVMYGDAAQVSSAYSDFTKLYRNLHSDLQPQNKVSNAEIARVAIREVLGEEYKNEVCAG